MFIHISTVAQLSFGKWINLPINTIITHEMQQQIMEINGYQCFNLQ
jgi:hypothetical protein